MLAEMRAHSLGREAALIGEVVDDHPGLVTMMAAVGGSRVVDMLSGEQFPGRGRGYPRRPPRTRT